MDFSTREKETHTDRKNKAHKCQSDISVYLWICVCANAIRLHTLEWATSVKMQIFTNMRTRPEIGMAEAQAQAQAGGGVKTGTL